MTATLEPISDAPKADAAKGGGMLDVVADAAREAFAAAKDQALQDVVRVLGTLGKQERKTPEDAPVETGDPLAAERSRVGRELDSLRAVFKPGQIEDMRDLQYRQFTPEVRKIRNPRVDQFIADWFWAVRSNDRETLARYERMERAVISEGTITATSGLAQGTAGALVPLPLENLIVLTRDKLAVMRSLCSIFQSPSLTLRVPKMGSATVYQVAEGSAATVGEPASTSVLLTKKKTQFRGQFSEEAVMDSAFNLVTILSERGGSAFAANEDVQAFTSAGTGANWTGSIETPNADSAGAQAVTEVAEASSGVLTYADVVKLYFTGMTQPYRARAVFFAASGMLQFLSSILDSNDRPIFAPSLDAARVVTGSSGDLPPGQIGTIFGRPVYEVPLSASSLLYFMDPKRYGILEGQRMAMKTTDAVGWTSDYIDFKVTVRMDGALLDNDAFARISGITSVA